jgi:hypothetical protein
VQFLVCFARMVGEVGFEPTVRVRDGVTARRPFLQNLFTHGAIGATRTRTLLEQRSRRCGSTDSPTIALVGDERLERSCLYDGGF